MKQFAEISPKLQSFIEAQKMFFVATAAREGKINLSPKGLDSLRVLNPTRLIWLNFTGSGNETAAHVLETKRMTLMLCSLEGPPNILRIYGSARAIHHHDSEWESHYQHFPHQVGARQIFDLEVELVQTSCGYAVPLYQYAGERDTLNKWADVKGEEGISAYWKEKNQKSIDGYPTGILSPDR